MTTEALKESLWRQFGASIDMLKNAIELCPEELLTKRRRIFYTIYHVLVFLDFYLSLPPQNFVAGLPFTLNEGNDKPDEAIDDVIPDRFYSKQELLDYLNASRTKCRTIIMGFTDEKLNERFIEDPPNGKNYSRFEILLYNMRHVQHHAAQLNLLLRQNINNAPKWVREAKD